MPDTAKQRMTNPVPQPEVPEPVPVPAQRKAFYSTGSN